MGNPKQKWTADEEEALRAGVLKHGAGKWKNIQRDPEFNKLLFTRSNIDLKDKWRNLSVASGQTPRDKSKAPKPKGPDAPATPLLIAYTSSSTGITPITQDVSTEVVMVDTSKPSADAHNASKYNAMIFEALSTLNEPNGSDCSSIAAFIEKRQEVPPNFKRALSSRLRRLVQQDKLEKVQNCYRIKSKGQTETRSPVIRTKESQPIQVQSIGSLGTTVEEAAFSAAYKIAEAENKSFVAAEAVKEAERVSTMAEDMEVLLQFAMDCFDESARGEILIMA